MLRNVPGHLQAFWHLLKTTNIHLACLRLLSCIEYVILLNWMKQKNLFWNLLAGGSGQVFVWIPSCNHRALHRVYFVATIERYKVACPSSQRTCQCEATCQRSVEIPCSILNLLAPLFRSMPGCPEKEKTKGDAKGDAVGRQTPGGWKTPSFF